MDNAASVLASIQSLVFTLTSAEPLGMVGAMVSTGHLVCRQAGASTLVMAKTGWTIKSSSHQTHRERPRLREVVIIMGCVKIAASSQVDGCSGALLGSPGPFYQTSRRAARSFCSTHVAAQVL